MDFSKSLQEKKIMVVDRDEWVRDSLTIFFQNEGCDFLALETAEEAISALREETFEVIMADYQLPGMDGLRFLRRISQEYPKAVRVLITGYGNPEVMEKAVKLGIHNFIEKPLSPAKIEDVLSKFISY